MGWRGEVAGVLVLCTMFVAILAAAEVWARCGRAPPEWSRKLVHLGGGLACLLFPLLLDSAWTVLGLAAAMSALLALGERSGRLHSLGRVERKSFGVAFYPVAIFVVYLLTRGTYWIYLSAVLVLAVADTGAALIGTRRGRIRYEVEDSYKSLEGSLAFLGLSWLAIFLPAVFLADLPPLHSALCAFLVALLLTGFEAISLGGTDNLFVPVAVCVILQKITTKPLAEVVYQNVSLLGILALQAGLNRKVRIFNAGGTFAFLLFTYGAWSLGSEMWALPALLGFVVYVGWRWLRPPEQVRVLKVRDVFRPALVPFFILLYANLYDQQHLLYGPYIAACAVIASFSFAHNLRRPGRRSDLLLAAILGCAVIGILPAWLQRVPPPSVLALFVVCVPVSLATHACAGAGCGGARRRRWLACDFIGTALAAGVYAALQWWVDFVYTWDPTYVIPPWG